MLKKIFFLFLLLFSTKTSASIKENIIKKTKIIIGKIYAFSYGDDDFSDYFEELGTSIKVVPIPISLLNAYRQAYAKGGIK